jgi:hypothetical protein
VADNAHKRRNIFQPAGLDVVAELLGRLGECRGRTDQDSTSVGEHHMTRFFR